MLKERDPKEEPGKEEQPAEPKLEFASVKTAGHAGDGLASMRTHTTPVKSAGHAGDGLASMRTHTTPVQSAGHAGDGLASIRAHATLVESAQQSVPLQDNSEVGEYWLPCHIDSNF